MNILLQDGSQFSLNPIQPEDQQTLHSLMDEVYRDAYRRFWFDQGDWYVDLIYNPQTVQKELSKSESHYFFVESAGRKIGILKYDYPLSPRQIEIPESMKLHRLYLHRDFHGTGIAQALIGHCEDVARNQGLQSIWLEVMECQPQAKRFYKKMAFEHAVSYTLDFEQLLPDCRVIEIWKKALN